MNLITSQRTYATQANALKALMKATNSDCEADLAPFRYLIAVNQEGRFVPTLVGADYVRFAHAGIMVVG